MTGRATAPSIWAAAIVLALLAPALAAGGPTLSDEGADCGLAPAAATPLGFTPGAEDVTCAGIRPGAAFSTRSSGCTMAFIFQKADTYYASTAGHCGRVGEPVFIDAFDEIGRFVFSTYPGTVGDDFALIEVHDEMEHLVQGAMCDMGGPSGIHASGGIRGKPLFSTGYGLIGDGTPARPKVLVGGSISSNKFGFSGPIVPGDSGSPVTVAQTGEALGIATHIAVDPNLMGINAGMRLTYGLELAASAGFDGLDLVTADHIASV